MYVGTSRSSSMNTDYYLGYFGNAKRSGSHASILFITNEMQPVSYFIDAIPGIQYNGSCGSFTVNNETIINLPDDAIVESDQDNKGIRVNIQSDRATVIGQNIDPRNSDTFLVLPVINAVNNTEEFIYYGMSVGESAASFNSKILIVGIENNTTMKVTTNSVHGNTYVINRLQSLLIESKNDLTGTKIVTNKTISLFSGHQAGSVTADTSEFDHLIEQIPSVNYWGREYYTAPLATRIKYSIKVLAAYDFTSVDVYCDGNHVNKSVIHEGGFVIKTFHNQEYCAIYSNNSVLVVQFSHTENNHGGPMMALVPATTHYLNRLDFSTIRNSSADYSHYINIVVMEQHYQPEMIYLIARGKNASLQSLNLSPVQIIVNGSRKAFAMQVNVSEGMVQLVHTDHSALITAMSYGFSSAAGYGHPGGLKLIGSYIYRYVMYIYVANCF